MENLQVCVRECSAGAGPALLGGGRRGGGLAPHWHS